MKIATQILKDATNKAIKGASNNNLMPLTSMIGLKLNDGVLSLLTTDMSNTLCVKIDKVAGDDVDITVPSEVFSKLINKLYCDTTELTLNGETLVVKGNGTYKIPLVVDEEGIVSFPDIEMLDSDKIKPSNVKLTSIMRAYNINRASLCKTLDFPELTGYYCANRVVSTDGNVITFNNFNLLGSESPVLISAQMMQLLTLNDSEDITLYDGGNTLSFVTDNVIITGPKLDGIDSYPYEDVVAYLDEAFESSCKVPKELLLSVLDRLSLFIEPYDNNCANFTFSRVGINIHSKKDSSTEVINYTGSDNFKSFSCSVNIPLLKEQLLAYPDDTVQIFYGNDNAIKLVSGSVIQVIALDEDSATADSNE